MNFNNRCILCVVRSRWNHFRMLGIGGTDMMDKGTLRHGKIIWGAIGFGSLKLALHRACIAQLFEDNKQVLDAENIFALAKAMA